MSFLLVTIPISLLLAGCLLLLVIRAVRELDTEKKIAFVERTNVTPEIDAAHAEMPSDAHRSGD